MSNIAEALYLVWISGMVVVGAVFGMLTLCFLLPFVDKAFREPAARLIGIGGNNKVPIRTHEFAYLRRAALFVVLSWIGFAYIVHILINGEAKDPNRWVQTEIRLNRSGNALMAVGFVLVLVIRYARGLPVIFWQFR